MTPAKPRIKNNDQAEDNRKKQCKPNARACVLCKRFGFRAWISEVLETMDMSKLGYCSHKAFADSPGMPDLVTSEKSSAETGLVDSGVIRMGQLCVEYLILCAMAPIGLCSGFASICSWCPHVCVFNKPLHVHLYISNQITEQAQSIWSHSPPER